MKKILQQQTLPRNLILQFVKERRKNLVKIHRREIGCRRQNAKINSCNKYLFGVLVSFIINPCLIIELVHPDHWMSTFLLLVVSGVYFDFCCILQQERERERERERKREREREREREW